jgi:hypothetical protein
MLVHKILMWIMPRIAFEQEREVVRFLYCTDTKSALLVLDLDVKQRDLACVLGIRQAHVSLRGLQFLGHPLPLDWNL